MKFIEQAKKLAETIGNVDPEMIAEVLEISEREKYLFHGTKNEKFPFVNNDGIPHRNARRGNESYWNLGPAAFAIRGEIVGNGQGTAFFDYALSAQNGTRFGNLAIAKVSDLGLVGKLDGEVRLIFPIPRNRIQLLHVEVGSGKADLEPRIYGQIVEREMLELVYTAVKQGYKPGELATSKKVA